MTPRRRWYLIWLAWVLCIALSFALLEAASWHGGTTLSRSVWELSIHFPLIIYLAGMLSGGLAVHFWWHWSPPGSISEG